MEKIKLELCLENYKTALIANKYGFDSIEINSSLALGGLTPSYGVLKEIEKIKGIEKNVMLRNRPSGFNYNQDEYEALKNELTYILELDIDGIVFGFLDKDFNIDYSKTSDFVKIIHSRGKKAIFHRAFDNANNPLESLNKLIDIGVDRILTSGQANTAVEGAQLIRQMINEADGKIEILIGSGVNSSNIEQLIEQTGGSFFHGSFKKLSSDQTSNKNISYDIDGYEGGAYIDIDINEIEKFLKIINKIGDKV